MWPVGGQRSGRSRCSDRDSIGPDKRVREEEGSKRPLGGETEDLRTDGARVLAGREGGLTEVGKLGQKSREVLSLACWA